MTPQNKKKPVSNHNRKTGEIRLPPNLNEKGREVSFPVNTTEHSGAAALGRILNLPFQKWQWAILGLISITFFVIYYLTTARSVPPGDSAELISAAWNLGVPHQPGYPLLMILSHLAGLIPIGAPAFRMNLLSAVLDALALGVLSFGIWRLLSLKLRADATKFEKLVPLISLIGGAGFLGFSTAFWQYSGQAEVFALNNFLSALLIVLMLEWQRQPDRIWLLRLSGLCTGLALTNQLTVVLLAPGLLTLLIAGIIKYRREAEINPDHKRTSSRYDQTRWLARNLIITVVLFLVGLLPYLYLILAARTDPAINIGDPSTLNNFWRVVTRADYGTFILSPGGAKGNLIIQVNFMWNHFLHNLTPAGIILAAAGVIWFIRERKLEGLALGLIFLFARPAFACFANPYLLNPITQGVFERFYILPGIPLAFFIAAGIFIIVDFIGRFAAKYSQKIGAQAVVVIGLLAVVVSMTGMAVDRYPSIKIYDNRVTENYGKDLLEPLEPDSLLILTDDHNFSATIYAQFVLGYRTDVVILHAEILKLPSYVAQQKRQHPQINIPFNFYDGGKSTFLESLIDANIKSRAVYGVGNIKEKISAFDKVEWGLGYRFLKKGEGQNPYVLMSPQISRFMDFHFPDKVYPITSWEFIMAYQYGRLAFTIASDLQQPQAQPDASLVEKMYRSAILNSPGYMASYKNLGVLLWKNNGPASEVVSLWEKYLKEVPNDPDKELMRQTIAQLGAP